MEHPFLYITWIFEQLGIGVHFAHSFPWVTGAWVVMLFLALVSILGATSVRLIPSGTQNVLEVVVTSLEDFFVDVTGEHGRFLFPLLGSYFLFIFTCNMIGLLPGFFSPTANMNTTLALALVTFATTHVIGLKTHGIKYIKHFMGSIWWLTPLFFIIEVISHLARVLSLTFRLFGNIVAEDLVLMILILLAGWFLAPLPMLVLFLFADFVQAFIFTLLSAMYFAGALEHAH